jgi:hypothetical protein
MPDSSSARNMSLVNSTSPCRVEPPGGSTNRDTGAPIDSPTQEIPTMSAPTSSGSLTGADLADNLHDIQDNVVEPILMRYGRHIFVKFHDGEKARAWLRAAAKR